MSGALVLTKFNRPTKHDRRPHKKLDASGRFTFKGKRLGAKKGQFGIPRKEGTKKYVPTGNPQGFQKGNHGFGGDRGKKKGFTHKYKLQDLIVAIKAVEEELEISPDATDSELMIHFVKRAFKSDPVLKDLMKKLLPDLKHVDAEIDVTEQFQLIIDATGDDDDDDEEEKKPVRKPKFKRKKHA